MQPRICGPDTPHASHLSPEALYVLEDSRDPGLDFTSQSSQITLFASGTSHPCQPPFTLLPVSCSPRICGPDTPRAGHLSPEALYVSEDIWIQFGFLLSGVPAAQGGAWGHAGQHDVPADVLCGVCNHGVRAGRNGGASFLLGGMRALVHNMDAVFILVRWWASRFPEEYEQVALLGDPSRAPSAAIQLGKTTRTKSMGLS
ncbi:hypothetical protein DUNSADRAFT_17091 [Dunaliella salina]|uniref:Encoded protein n=1 Tax=Dunaliella salina TaxID=3046 RepID=A0ABQ7G2F1_DUNSA|nr:hypothetical protein DUNSADRAFT_17091 [Dunaliella salina]|eukprot:KAF5828774.1 hypothetical protein DUNSADRAFT_17091 [Dunaliella salina]